MRTYKEIKDECADRVAVAKVYLTFNQAFYGVLVNRMEFIATSKIDTLATDGKNIFYNPCYIMGETPSDKEHTSKRKYHTDRQKKHIEDGKLTDLELVGGLVHEVLHCAFKHFTRRDGRNKQVWNIACDYAINQIIKRDKIGKLNPRWLYNIKYDRMTAEQIYDSLMGEYNNDIKKILEEHGDSIDHHIDPQFEVDPENSDAEITIDDIKEMLQDDGLPSENVIPAYCSCAMDDISVLASSCASMVGCPESLLEMIKVVNEPVVDWRRRILQTMLSELSTNYWWNRPNKRTHRTRYKLPSRKPEKKIDICVAIDMSGSITENMRMDFLSELVGIAKQHRFYRIRVMCFDTKVMNEQIFDSTTTDLNDMMNYQFMGGGGTDFMCVWKHLKNVKYKPEHLFMFTDGYPAGKWGIPKYCTTTFLITTKVKPPFGNHIEYRKDAKYRKKFGT